MNVRTWLRYIVLLISFILGSVASINYSIDPLWMFSYDNRFNNMQYSMDDRQLKTNKFYFRPEKEIDTLLLGSSRTSYISEDVFKKHKVFNFAEDMMCPFEMAGLIESAKLIKQDDFKTIIIGLDFFSASKGKFIDGYKKENADPSAYLNKAKSPLYRFSSSLSLSTLKYSLRNIKTSLIKDKHIVYNRDNIKSYFPYNKEKQEEVDTSLLEFFKQNHYGTFEYDENISNVYKEIQKNNPNTELIVFISPVDIRLYNLMKELGLMNDYKRWLKDVVKVFGNVYNFMGENSINVDKNNYRDPQHFDPKIGTLVARRIMNQEELSTPNDFGVLVTANSIDKYIENISQRDN